ncbi:MAG: phosphate ABC transporter substrate-binding protein PstS family protein [Clostridiales bacterium]|nr:phosphate ABC transporter substrate-binding protein PstS family protein [Clostridiales bacterium]
MKKVLFLLVVTIMAFAMMSPFAFAADPIKLVIDSKTITPTVAPVVERGVTLVPLRSILETLGADVSWNATAKQAKIETAAHVVTFTINATTYNADNSSKTLEVPAKIINGSTMIPLRAVSEAIGATVDYNGSSNTVNISYFTKMSGSLKISGSTTLQPIVQAAADKLIALNKGLSITVSGGGSGTGIKDAEAGTVNIGMSSRELTDDEAKTLTANGVANDGIAIIVHPSNKVNNLTKDQAAKIFLGEIKNWKDVGGNDAPIIVTTRESGSGTRSTLEEMIMNKESVVATATPYSSSQLIKQAVAKDANAIGFDSIGFVDKTVKALSLNSIAATSESVLSGKYGMGRELLCCTKGKATGLTAVFIDYLRSRDCQDNIVVKEGYVKWR